MAKKKTVKECTGCGGDGNREIDVECDRQVGNCEDATSGLHTVIIDCPCCEGTGVEK